MEPSFIEEEKQESNNNLIHNFINYVKLTSKKIIKNKNINIRNCNLDEILFDKDGSEYIKNSIEYFTLINDNISLELLLTNKSNNCFRFRSIQKVTEYTNNYKDYETVFQIYYEEIIFFKKIIIIKKIDYNNYYINHYEGEKDTKINQQSYTIYRNIISLNTLFTIKSLLNEIIESNDIEDEEREFVLCDIKEEEEDYTRNKYNNYFNTGVCFQRVYSKSFIDLFTQMEKKPQYFVNNCVEFENLCNQEKQNYIEKISILENERKEIEVIKQECNEKMETYHKLQNEYDEFQQEKQKLEEEKKKLQLVKLKLEQMKRKLDEEREEFEKQKAELTETNINLDELLNL
jgi:hypothetical protein